MLNLRIQNVLLLLFGCMTCLQMASVVIADGQVFVVELRNSSGLLGYTDAERVCASQQSRLASAEELHQAVVDCFFSTCTRGWLYGGTVGSTVCNGVGSSQKAVDVKTENVTDDLTNLNTFCIKDQGKPCGDPPAFPNAHLQTHTGFELGDELMYSCMPGYVMPSGSSSFSLLCDSCGEWYGLVQLCVKDDTEAHVDYEDKFTDSTKQHNGPAEAQGQVHEEVHDGKGFHDQSQEITFNVDNEDEHQDQEHVALEEPENLSKNIEEAALGEEQAEEGGDYTVNQSWGQERSEIVQTQDIPSATTHSPVSLLSQKHLFWFPSEAFHEGHPVSSNSAMQSSTGIQSAESKEQESTEIHQQATSDFTGQETIDVANPNITHSQESHQDDKDDHVIQYKPTQHNVDLSRRDRYDNREEDEHYDMGEHEDDRIRVRFDSQEYEQTYDEHLSYEDQTDDTQSPDSSIEHIDHHDDVEEPYDPDDNDSYEDNSREQHVVISIDGERQNATQKPTKVKPTSSDDDDTWLDGYPIVQKESEQDSSTEKLQPGQKEVATTENPNEIDAFLNTGSSTKLKSATSEPGLELLGEEDAIADVNQDHSDSNFDTIDYDTQQAAPTNSWHGDLTEHPYLNQGPAPPMNDLDVSPVEEHTIDNLPGEIGERGEVEGEKGEAICMEENCPPKSPNSSRRGPTVAAIIIAVCVVAAAVVVGVWCYRRQLQKSSVYEMNGKGQSQKRQGQQIEMQQKV